MKKLLTLTETSSKIIQGEKLIIAGVEELLAKLPNGEWIGGTIPYFMGDDGGVFSTELLLVETLPNYINNIKIKMYNDVNLPHFANDEFKDGFSVILIPAFSKIHEDFAKHSGTYDNIFNVPLIGWITGVDLNKINELKPKVFDGKSGQSSDCDAIVMHVELPTTKYANIDIVNVFNQGDGDLIVFPTSGFSAENCYVNGKLVNFAEYLTSNNINTQLPLVANYYNTMFNVSFQSLEDNKVNFYAPVFKDVEYKIATPVENYVKNFTSIVEDLSINPTFSCNCILNYLYAELEGKKTANIQGPMTFGEIAYQLLNQTMVYLTIKEY